MWRKTRQPSEISSCIGADPNRNYDSHWMENEGASSNPCAEDYGGPKPFSEPEIQAMSEFVISIKDKINVLLAFHSYSQLLLSPYGHTKEEFPPNFDDMMEVAKAYGDAVESLPYGTVYRYGSAAGILCKILDNIFYLHVCKLKLLSQIPRLEPPSIGHTMNKEWRYRIPLNLGTPVDMVLSCPRCTLFQTQRRH